MFVNASIDRVKLVVGVNNTDIFEKSLFGIVSLLRTLPIIANLIAFFANVLYFYLPTIYLFVGLA